MNISKRVVLITGAASGIGYGIAQEFAKSGSEIVIFDLDLAKAQQSAECLTKDFNIKAKAYEVNISNPDVVQSSIDKVAQDFGKIDVLVNNAGIQIIDSFVDFTLENWQKIFDVHVTGSFLMAQAVMRQMIKQGNGGKLIFIGSVHSIVPALNKSAYIAAKHAKIGMVRAIAKESAPYNIAVNLVGPGYVRTHLIEKQIPEQAKALNISEEDVIQKILLPNTLDHKFTTEQEVGKCVLFLADFPGLGLTGQSIFPTHGWLMEA